MLEPPTSKPQKIYERPERSFRQKCSLRLKHVHILELIDFKWPHRCQDNIEGVSNSIELYSDAVSLRLVCVCFHFLVEYDMMHL